MQFVSDPPIADKIRKMKERVRWQAQSIIERAIDQTQMVIDDGGADNPEFSFLVLGDTGSGSHPDYHPPRKIAELMLHKGLRSHFVLHTGDIIYQVGSSEYYFKNFILPYHEWLVGGESPENIGYDQMVFKQPFLPVPGNHDYYELPLVYGVLAQVSWPMRHLLRTKLDLGVGWHGSGKGKAYAKAFLDYLQNFNEWGELQGHLDRHYTAKTSTGHCLRYQPGVFTRLPNRYYSFRYGQIDFIALDSNTFNAPEPLPDTAEGDILRSQLVSRQNSLEVAKEQILTKVDTLDRNNPDEAEILDDYQAKLAQIEESQLDIEKQLTADQNVVTDFEQLDWLKHKLIDSWNTSEVRGRIIYLHHPPYVTETTKWDQAQTWEIRHRLRWVFDAVAKNVGKLAANRPIVDLVISGHAHCLEHLYTKDTGHGDAHINWLVCGGSGHSLRRQRSEGPELVETFRDLETNHSRTVAYSQLFIGRNGHGAHKRRPYSFLRIDVKSGNPPKFIVQPFVAERYQKNWHHPEIQPFVINY